MKHYKRHNSGFTFLELLVTISVISVLAVLSYQSLASSIESQNATMAASQIMNALNKARYYAKTKGKSTFISLPTDSNEYSIEEADGTSLIQTYNIDGASGKLPGNTKILENSCGDFYFYVDGTPMYSVGDFLDPLSSRCEIVVGNEDGLQKTLIINPHTGSIVYDE